VTQSLGDPNPLLLYDGVCGLCNRLVQFSLKRDRKRRLRFASLQSNFAAAILQRHNLAPRELDTVYFVERVGLQDELLTERSAAVIQVLREIGGSWSIAAVLLSVIPKWLRDRGYSIVARNRYRIFGKSDTCVLPQQQYRDRFLDV
jgi:predicted DCC family thiol-disulfide oxidoreductase YuxK